MRLIDADAMIADLLTVDPQYETMIKWCCTVVDAQPTIEPSAQPEPKCADGCLYGWGSDECKKCTYRDYLSAQERKTGKWIQRSRPTELYTEWWHECSECGNRPARCRYGNGDYLSDFCPNCGADMRGGQDEPTNQ